MASAASEGGFLEGRKGPPAFLWLPLLSAPPPPSFTQWNSIKSSL